MGIELKKKRSSPKHFYSENGRGPAMLKKLTKIKDNEERVKVMYNEYGQPIGEGKTDLSSYSGLLVKSLVPINIKDWHQVPKSLKKNLWRALQVKIDVDPRSQKSMPTWNIIMGPRQPDSVQCGYHVMRFMKELIEEPSQSIEIKMRKLAGKERYTREEINEVRVELIEFVVEHIEA